MKTTMTKYMLSILLLCTPIIIYAQQAEGRRVKISGRVQFLPSDRPDYAERLKKAAESAGKPVPPMRVTLVRRQGTSRIKLAEAEVDAEQRSYTMLVPADSIGTAMLDCGGWQSVQVWIEDEDLEVDFRGVDTARVVIKNPPYAHIKGGRNNELMNLVNFESYRNYQQMIAVSQSAYHAKFADEESKKQLTSQLYEAGNDNMTAHLRYLAQHYADRNSVIAILSQLDDEADRDLISATLAQLRSRSATSAELADRFERTRNEQKQQRLRMAVGQPAPDFNYLTPDGESKSLSSLRGKIVVLDFWASWCGPCRAEIPSMKRIYEEEGGEGVEFLSVSIDSDKKAWEEARTDEAMPWLQGWQQDGGKRVMELYQFNGIPFIVVIDREGRLYRKNVRGKDVQTAIKDCMQGKPATSPKAQGGVRAVGMSAM